MPLSNFKRPMRGNSINPLFEMSELFNAALDEFSSKSFEEASLNDILKAAGISKGSFYYKFSDKIDLYLCLIDRIAFQKLEYFASKQNMDSFPDDFFDQLRSLANAGLEYARFEPRYFAFGRRLLSETGSVRMAVKDAFPDTGLDSIKALVTAARAKGQLSGQLTDEFISGILFIIFNNIDTMISSDMNEEQMMEIIDNLLIMLRYGLRP